MMEGEQYIFLKRNENGRRGNPVVGRKMHCVSSREACKSEVLSIAIFRLFHGLWRFLFQWLQWSTCASRVAPCQSLLHA